MKSILTLSVFLTLFAACSDNKTESKTEERHEETISASPKVNVPSDTNTTKNTEPKTANNKISVVDLVGTWEQVKTQPIGNDVVTGVITVKLLLNGDFVSSAKTSSKLQKPQNSPEQRGKWTLYGNTVSLSGMRKLEYNQKTQTLIDVAADVELTKQ